MKRKRLREKQFLTLQKQRANQNGIPHGSTETLRTSERLALTDLQTARGTGVCKSLILLAGFRGDTPPPVFWQKSSDLLDSKGLDS